MYVMGLEKLFFVCPAELVYINFIVRCSFVALLIKSTHLIICGLSVTTEKSTSGSALILTSL